MNKYIVFDIGGTFIKYAVIDEKFNILKKDKFLFDAINRDCKNEMIKEIGEISKKLIIEYDKIVGIGVSTAGDVDPHTTKIIGSVPNHNKYIGTNFKEELLKYIDLPLVIDNDANIAILGEYVNGQLKGYKNAVMITLGTDIGCGILIDGKVFTGESGCAANAGYLNILGRRWGTYFSAIGLKRLIKEIKNIENLEPIDILLDNNHQDIANYWYEGLAIGIANIIALLSPKKFVIGGGLSESKKIDVDKIKKIVHKHLIEKHISNACEIELSTSGNEAAFFGCVELLNRKLIND